MCCKPFFGAVTCFKISVPENPDDKRKHGYSHDHRGDCPQVVIALVITPEGYPLAYEVLPGNCWNNIQTSQSS